MQAITDIDVYHAGELTVIGFGNSENLDELNVAEFNDEIKQLIRDNNCQDLAVDLTGIQFIPRGLLGVLTSVYRRNINVHLFNTSNDIREVLEITKLDRLFYLHNVEV